MAGPVGSKHEAGSRPPRSAALATALAVALALGSVVGTPVVAHDHGGPGAVRTLPASAVCGGTIAVEIEVTPAPDTTAWILVETPPELLPVLDVDPEDNGAATGGAVTWVSLLGGAATRSYVLSVPEDVPDGTVFFFSGEYRLWPSMDARAPVTGDEMVTVSCGSVARSVPAGVECGVPFEVTLHVDAPAGGFAWLLDEVPPEIPVLDVDPSHHGGLLDGHVTWVSVFNDDASVTYTLEAPLETPDGTVLFFDGTYRFDPSMTERAAVGGDSSTVVSCASGGGGPVFHLFDADQDCRFDEAELFAVIGAWKHQDPPPSDDDLFLGIKHWKLFPQTYCEGSGNG